MKISSLVESLNTINYVGISKAIEDYISYSWPYCSGFRAKSKNICYGMFSFMFKNLV